MGLFAVKILNETLICVSITVFHKSEKIQHALLSLEWNVSQDDLVLCFDVLLTEASNNFA